MGFFTQSFSLPQKDLVNIAREFERYKRLVKQAERVGWRPRKIWKPDWEEIHQLRKEIAALPRRKQRCRRLTPAELKKWITFAERLYERQRRLETLIHQQGVNLRQLGFRSRRAERLSYGAYLVLKELLRSLPSTIGKENEEGGGI